MASHARRNPSDFTVAELEAMLAAKTQLDELEAQRAGLMKELDKVEKHLAKLLSGAAASRKPARKKAAKKVVGTKATKGKARKAAQENVRKRATKKAAKKSTKKAASQKLTKKTTATGRPTIESVVVDLLAKKGEPMAFKDILGEIQKKKLVKTKSKDFGNVLRRVLSTSKAVKRTGRGIFTI